MKKDLELWQFVAERLKLNVPLTLLVVAESAGSSPGRKGFKMAIAKDEITGSVGGGVMEVRLVELAKGKSKKAKVKNDSAIVKQNHRKNAPNPSGMICSGRQTVIFFGLNPNHFETVQEIIRALENHQPKILQISNSQLKISENAQEEFDYKFKQSGENEFLYEEKLGYKNRLFIVGGGHCALALSELASKMDFYISLFDDRPNLNTLDKNRYVHEKHIIKSYEQIDEFIASGANHFVVVMTLGYKSDETVVRRLFDKNFKYFGVLGSKAKMKTLFRKLEKEGFPKEKLEKIHTPIGLPINSQTPEEIAVSIAAEIIAVKNAKR